MVRKSLEMFMIVLLVIYTLKKKLTTDLPRNGKIMNVCYDNVNSMCFIYINGNKQMQWCFEIKFKFKHVLVPAVSYNLIYNYTVWLCSTYLFFQEIQR